MKTLFFLPIFFMSLPTLAHVRTHFLGTSAMIQILPTDPLGTADEDSARLYQALAVPEQGSSMGPGKIIQTKDKIFVLTCARQQKGTQCTVLVQASPQTKLSPTEKIVHFHLEGAPADELRALFRTDENGQYTLSTFEGYLRLTVQPGSFDLLFNGNGI